MKCRDLLTLCITLTAITAISTPARVHAAEDTIIVQSTTSTANSGLYDHILPVIRSDTGVTVRVVAVGTGQAIKNARRCDADVLLVHARSSEQKFVADGYGTRRHDLMYNDFVLVGPPTDPAGIAGTAQATAALKKIAGAKAVFASRGDSSGTHKKEMSLWQQAGVDPAAFSGGWYRETGSGMGATLNVGIGMNAYVMTDRATWISFNNKADHQIMVQGDDALFNQYGVIPVNPSKCPKVKVAASQKFVEWLLSAKGQQTIAQHKIAGQQLFFPNARPR